MDKHRQDPKLERKNKSVNPDPLPPPLDPEDIDVEANPNAVPDPYHDTRAVHGDTGRETKEDDK